MEWAKAHFFVGDRHFKGNAGRRGIQDRSNRARVAASEGLEVVEVAVKGGGASRLVRISIDKPEGVTHGDCELVSQQVGTILDVEDVVPGGRYTLEVSSPGVERKLTKPGDFVRFQGKKIKLTCASRSRDAATGKARWPASRDGRVTLETGGQAPLRVALDEIQKANLKFEW
jgi:ribosome maturation factor RimP